MRVCLCVLACVYVCECVCACGRVRVDVCVCVYVRVSVGMRDYHIRPTTVKMNELASSEIFNSF